MKFVYFLLYPFFAFITSLFRFREKESQFVVLCFLMMAAYQTHPYADMNLYLDKFDEISHLDFSSFLDYMGKKFILEGNYEIFVETNAFLVSRFTQNVKFTFVVTVVILFFVWRGIITALIKEYDFNRSKNKKALYLLICFSIYVIFYRVINGRFYLAYWIFIFAFHKIFIEKKTQYFSLLFLTILVHQAFLFLVAISLVYFFIQKFVQNRRIEYILLILIVIGTLYSQLGISYLSKYLTFFGDSYENKYSDYLKDSYVENQLERDRKWFILLRTPLLFYSLGFHILYLRFYKKINFENVKTLYFFILIFWVINSFTIEVPSFGDRFRNVLMGFFILLLFKLYNSKYRIKNTKLLMFITLGAFIFYKIVSLKVLEFYINKWSFFPFSMVFHALFD